MKNIQLSTSKPEILPIVFGLLAALLIFAELTGRKIPFLRTDRSVLIALAILGLIICSTGGISKVAQRGDWFHPLSILGYLLGIIILLVTAAGVFNFHIPLISSVKQSIWGVAALSATKFIIVVIHNLIT